jgi:hypothetical protein
MLSLLCTSTSSAEPAFDSFMHITTAEKWRQDGELCFRKVVRLRNSIVIVTGYACRSSWSILFWSEARFMALRVAFVMSSQHKHDGGVDENNIDSNTNEKYIFSPCLYVSCNDSSVHGGFSSPILPRSFHENGELGHYGVSLHED